VGGAAGGWTVQLILSPPFGTRQVYLPLLPYNIIIYSRQCEPVSPLHVG
jgi:hypothetical protein